MVLPDTYTSVPLRDLEIKPVIRCVAFDETEDWSEEIRKMVGGKIWTAYVYDASVVTYACSLTPAHELRFVEYIVGESEAYDRLSEEDREVLLCKLDEASAEEGNHLQDCAEWRASATLQDYNSVCEPSDLDETPAEVLDEWYEYLRCNGGCWSYLHSLFEEVPSDVG